METIFTEFETASDNFPTQFSFIEGLTVLQPATETILGGIKVGEGLLVEPDGTLNVGQVNVNKIVQNPGDEIIFNCGKSDFE